MSQVLAEPLLHVQCVRWAVTSRAGLCAWYSSVTAVPNIITCARARVGYLFSQPPVPARGQDDGIVTESSCLGHLLTSPGVIISDWLIVNRNRPLNVVTEPSANDITQGWFLC